MNLKRVTVKSIFHLIYAAICCGICYFQAHRIMNLYFKYPIYTVISDFQMPNLEFPAITICSSIAIRKSMLLAMEHGEDLMNANASAELQLQLDRYYHQYLEDHPMEKLIVDTLNFDDVANPEKITCLADTILSSNYCKELQIHALNSSENLKSCFTLFHGSVPNPLRDDPKLAPSSSIYHSRIIISNETLTATRENKPFNRGEIMRFIVSMNDNESTSLHLPTTGDIRIHESLRIPTYVDNLIEFQSGQALQIAFTLQIYRILEPPYRTRCRNFYEGPERDSSPLFGHLLGHFDCGNSCIAKFTIKRCHCWPPEIPYLADRKGNWTKNLFLCDWMEMAKKKLNETIDPHSPNFLEQNKKLEQQAFNIFDNCTGSWFDFCEKKCRLSCYSAFIDLTYEVDPWPPKQRTEASAEDLDLEKCCALISLRYTRYQKKFIYTPRYELVSTVSNIFGIVNLWLGFILVGSLHYFKKFGLFVCDTFKVTFQRH